MQLSYRLLTIVLLISIIPCREVRAQDYNPDIDVLQYRYLLGVSDTSDRIAGEASLTILFKKDTKTFRLDLDKGMVVSSIDANGQALPFTQDASSVAITGVFQTGQTTDLKIIYGGIPADGLIIANNKYGHRGFFGDNWPNRAHNWLPCVDDPSDKAPVEFLIQAPAHYTVVANGALVEEKPLDNNTKLTHWKETAPLSPKIMVVGIADFAVDHPGDAMGVPVWNYVYKEDRAIGFQSYSHALQILPFYISHIGPYPFLKCGNVQSKTRFGGLENAGAIFYYEGSVSSPGIESLMAHEIAHQWFGDAATETEWKHLWLSEGFATYMTHCYLESRYGADTLRAGMKKDRDQVIRFEAKRLTAIVDTTVHEDYMQLLNPNSYQKGSWVLHMLRRKLGDQLFWKTISAYYATYRGRNASSEDLNRIADSVSGQNLHPFFHQWLDRPGHPKLRIGRKNNTLEIDQVQPELYQFSFEYAVDGKIYKAEVKEKHTSIKLPPNAKITYDPNSNLLYEEAP